METPSRSGWRAWLRRTAEAARGAWVIAGLTLLFALGLELAYRAQAALRRAVQSPPVTVTLHPYAREPWFKDYRAELSASFGVAWQPYVYWRHPPFAGRYITVDSLGHRRTVQSAAPGDRVRHVYFFGGSTMWGTMQRDSFTIPSVAATALAARGLRDVEVTNFGETGYVFTQEVLALELELRRGARPDVVVFYDGINDVAAATIVGQAGLPHNEVNRAAEFRLGRVLDAHDDGRALLTLARLSAWRSRLLQRIARVVAHRGGRPPPPGALAEDVVRTYARTIELVESLAGHYRFRPIYFWQPTLQVTGKRKTAFEEAIAADRQADPAFPLRQAVHLAALALVGSAAAPVAAGHFANLATIFDEDTASVFLDHIGHTTEAANAEVVAAILPFLERALREPLRTARR